MNAISRALKNGNLNAVSQNFSQTTLPSHEPTTVAKQYLSAQEGTDVNLGMLDQEAFARAIASEQHSEPLPVVPSNTAEEEEEEDTEIVDDVTYRPSGVGPTDGTDPIGSLRLTCLPVLDILSTEILKILCSHPHSTILQIVTGSPASPLSHSYINLLHILDTTKKTMYSDDPYQAFLNPDILGFKDVQERKVIRKANLATFISSVYGSSDVGFFHLNEGFLSTLAPDGGRLLKDMGRLYLDLKTQAYISAMGQPSRDQNAILSDLFPSTAQLSLMLISRRTKDNQPAETATQDDLTPSEVEFITKCERRREHLRSLGDSEEQVRALKESYSWETFLKELRIHIAKNWEIIVGSKGGKPRRPKKRPSAAAASAMLIDDVTTPTYAQPVPQPQEPQSSLTAMHVPAPTAQPVWEAYEKARMANSTSTSTPTASTGIPPPQTQGGNSADHPLRPGSDGYQVRRPWSREEEAALFAGLEAVQGPNWAQILQLHGPGGSVSEALKDRSQVQLKDKARNLKLFFLKGGHVVPSVLRHVTGRLKDSTGEPSPKKTKKRKTGDTPAEDAVIPATQQHQGYNAGEWPPSGSQGLDFGVGGIAGQNMDPDLSMTHDS